MLSTAFVVELEDTVGNIHSGELHAETAVIVLHIAASVNAISLVAIALMDVDTENVTVVTKPVD